MRSVSGPRYRLGKFIVLPRTNELRHNGHAQRVSPRAMQVLGLLMEAGTDCVSRNSIIERVWDDNFAVGDHGLRGAIWELRKALGDNPKRPEYIQTVPRRGYRLVQTAQGAGVYARFRRPALAAAAGAAAVLMLWLGTLPLLPQQSGDWRGPAPVVSGDRQRVAAVYEDRNQVDLYIWPGPFEDFANALAHGPGQPPDQARQITNSVALETSPVWSPDNQSLAFLEHPNGGSQCRVRIYDVDQARLRTLAEDCFVVSSPVTIVPSQLAWSPDGRFLTYQARTAGDGDSAVLARVEVDQPVNNRAITERRPGIDAFPRYSSDGRLAFLRLQDSMMAAAQLHVLDAAARPVLVCPTTQIWGLAWVGQDYLVSAAAQNNPFSLWLLDTSTGLTLRAGSRARHIQSSTVADTLLVDHYRAEPLLQLSSLTHERPPENLEVPGIPIAVAAQGDQLAVVTASSGGAHLFVLEPSGSFRPVFTAREIYRPAISPDGRRIVLSTRNSLNENTRPVVIDLVTQATSELAVGDGAVFFGAWMPEGQGFYALHGVPSPLGRRAVLKAHWMDGRAPETLAADTGITIAAPADGSLWWADDRGDIWRKAKPDVDAPVEPVLRLSSLYDSWTVDVEGQRLLFTERNGPGVSLMELDRVTGQLQERLTLASGLDPILGVALGQDDTLIYRRTSPVWNGRSTVPAEAFVGLAQNSDYRWQQCFHPEHPTGQKIAGH